MKFQFPKYQVIFEIFWNIFLKSENFLPIQNIHRQIPYSHHIFFHNEWSSGVENDLGSNFSIKNTSMDMFWANRLVIGSLEKWSPVISWFYAYVHMENLEISEFQHSWGEISISEISSKKWKFPIPTCDTGFGPPEERDKRGGIRAFFI